MQLYVPAFGGLRPANPTDIQAAAPPPRSFAAATPAAPPPPVRPGPTALHEAGHMVAAHALGVTFYGAVLCADGSADTWLCRPSLAEATAAELRRFAAVTLAGAAAVHGGEFYTLFEAGDEYADDRQSLAAVRAEWAARFTGRPFWTALDLAEALAAHPAADAAVWAVAVQLQTAGSVTADQVREIVARTGFPAHAAAVAAVADDDQDDDQ